jgi:hypothetical protein
LQFDNESLFFRIASMWSARTVPWRRIQARKECEPANHLAGGDAKRGHDLKSRHKAKRNFMKLLPAGDA